MKYEKTVAGLFLNRPNRFLAHVQVGDEIHTVHVKNTGRCRELLIPGSTVCLCEGSNPHRRTRYDLISVLRKSVGWVNIDSQVPNRAVADWLSTRPAPFADVKTVRPEYAYGQSRVDFYLESNTRKILLEVKGCTLERDGTGYFPDAPTQRGTRHLQELIRAVREGYESYLAFVIALNGVHTVLPNTETDPVFARALVQAVQAGVHILYLPCRVTGDSIEITSCLTEQTM